MTQTGPTEEVNYANQKALQFAPTMITQDIIVQVADAEFFALGDAV